MTVLSRGLVILQPFVHYVVSMNRRLLAVGSRDKKKQVMQPVGWQRFCSLVQMLHISGRGVCANKSLLFLCLKSIFCCMMQDILGVAGVQGT